MKNGLRLAIILLVCYTMFNCKSDNVEIGHLLTFDIEPNGKNIVFSWKNGNTTSIYKCDIDGKNTRKILGNDSLSYYAPRYSKGGDSLSFIATDYPNTLLTSLGIYNFKESSSKLVAKDSLLKTEVVFSKNGNELYFLGANEYDKYSTTGRKAPHRFDIYEFNIKENKLKRATNFNAYQMNHLKYLQNDLFLFSSFLNEMDGVFLYNHKKEEINMITIKNDSLKSLNGFSEADYINENSLLYTSYYEINRVDLNQNKRKKIYRSKSGNHISNLSYSKKLDKLFVSEQKQNFISILDLDGNLIKTIHLSVESN